MSDDRVLHCWEDNPDTAWDEMSSTCMLPAGHDGPHVFTPDDQIVVQFAEGDDAPIISPEPSA